MFKSIKYSALLAMFILVIVFSCQKNKSYETIEEQEFQMTESAQLVYNKLLAFKQALNNPPKSTTSMQLDSAEWYVEAFYNVTLGYPDSLFGKFEVDTMYYSLPLEENQMVGISDLGLLLDNMENHLNSLLAQTGSEVAHMVVGDVVVDFSGRSSEAEIIVYTGLGFGTGSLYQPFAVDDDWYYGNMLGRCDGQYQWESDAGEELEWRFNSPNPYYVPYPACNDGKVVIIGTSHVWETGLTDDRIYYDLFEGSYNPPCLDSQKLNTLLNHGADLFYQKDANNGLIPDGNNFFTSVEVYSFADSIPSDGWRYYHGYAAYYSTYICVPNGGSLFD